MASLATAFIVWTDVFYAGQRNDKWGKPQLAKELGPLLEPACYSPFILHLKLILNFPEALVCPLLITTLLVQPYLNAVSSPTTAMFASCSSVT